MIPTELKYSINKLAEIINTVFIDDFNTEEICKILRSESYFTYLLETKGIKRDKQLSKILFIIFNKYKCNNDIIIHRDTDNNIVLIINENEYIREVSATDQLSVILELYNEKFMHRDAISNYINNRDVDVFRELFNNNDLYTYNNNTIFNEFEDCIFTDSGNIKYIPKRSINDITDRIYYIYKQILIYLIHNKIDHIAINILDNITLSINDSSISEAIRKKSNLDPQNININYLSRKDLSKLLNIICSV